jgi:hypothetical protein
MRQYRIPKSTIEELKRMFEDASEHHVSEVSKVQAIQMLLPQIEVMLNKGYSVSDIASMLTEKGVVVTPITLRAYLGKFKEKSENRRVARSRSTRSAGRQAPGVSTTSKSQLVANDSSERSRPVAGSTESKSTGEVGKSSQPPKTAPPTVASEAPPRVSREPPPNRFGFVPRKDTENI